MVNVMLPHVTLAWDTPGTQTEREILHGGCVRQETFFFFFHILYNL